MNCFICIWNISYRIPCIIIITITANAYIIPVIQSSLEGEKLNILSHLGSEAFIFLTR